MEEADLMSQIRKFVEMLFVKEITLKYLKYGTEVKYLLLMLFVFKYLTC